MVTSEGSRKAEGFKYIIRRDAGQRSHLFLQRKQRNSMINLLSTGRPAIFTII
jgi:hypothetical protein